MADYEQISMSQSENDAASPSDLYLGRDAHAFRRKVWPDFKTDGIEVVLHERPSG